MKILLDTHVFLWGMSGERVLGARAAATLAAAETLLISVISFAEIGVKAAVGKLDPPPDVIGAAHERGVRILRLEPVHGLEVAALPLHHRDPFDRLLIAQARAEGLVILTADRRFADYDVGVVAALA